MLSLKIAMDSSAKVVTFIYWKNLLNQTASCTEMTYPNSIVDRAMQDYFLLHQVIVAPLSKKAYPIMDLHLSLSLAQSSS